MASIISETTGSLSSFGGVPIDGLGKTAFEVKQEVNPNALYAVNWGELQKVEDLILVLASIGFVFSPQHQHWNQIKHLLDLKNPIIPQQPQSEGNGR